MSNRPKIIIADPNESSLVYLSTLLDRMNFEVFPLRVIEEAYELAKIVRPNLFFIESCTKVKTSLTILEMINKDNLLSKTPVVMVGQRDADVETFFASGCCDFLTKPFGLTTLNICVQKCFPNREGMRRHLRVPYHKNISYDHNGVEARCYAVTLSEGGVYLRTNKPLPVSSKIKIRLSLETGDEVCLAGTVIYIMALSRGSFLIPPGMAVKFDVADSDSEQIKAISSEVTQLLVGDLLEEQDEPIFLAD
jgi:DNA-binding response OmpR family regulator